MGKRRRSKGCASRSEKDCKRVKKCAWNAKSKTCRTSKKSKK